MFDLNEPWHEGAAGAKAPIRRISSPTNFIAVDPEGDTPDDVDVDRVDGIIILSVAAKVNATFLRTSIAMLPGRAYCCYSFAERIRAVLSAQCEDESHE